MTRVQVGEEAARAAGGPDLEGEVPCGPECVGDIPAFLGRIRAGDEDAARELLTRYEAEVRLVVRRQLPRLLRSRFDSLDFLQSVWGSFFQRVRSGPTDFENSRHLVAFLARAAKNKVIDEYRRAASRKQDMTREEPLWVDGTRPRELADHVDSPSEVAQAREVFGQLKELVPEERRTVLELKAEGLSSRDIGERLGISERTVQRVLEDLRRRAEEWQRGRREAEDGEG
jgi:RNA polymerase sigma factor (sigma-70 family)